MRVLLVEGLSQMLSTAYHSPAGRTSTPATATGTQVSRMSVMAVGVARMGRRTHYLALPTKGKTKSAPSLCNSHVYLLQYGSLRENSRRTLEGFASSSSDSLAEDREQDGGKSKLV